MIYTTGQSTFKTFKIWTLTALFWVFILFCKSHYVRPIRYSILVQIFCLILRSVVCRCRVHHSGSGSVQLLHQHITRILQTLILSCRCQVLQKMSNVKIWSIFCLLKTWHTYHTESVDKEIEANLPESWGCRLNTECSS